MSVTVRRATGQVDTWAAIPGETRWVDYAHEREGDELVVYLHTFRRVRERADADHDVLLWKPATAGLAHRYADGEWAEVVSHERDWPPAEVEQVDRRPRVRRRTRRR